MKKILSAFLVVALLFTMTGLTALAEPTNLIWSLKTDVLAANNTQNIALTIKLDQNSGMASQYFDVKFNTNDLEYVPVTGIELTRKYYLGDSGYTYTDASQFLQSEFIDQGIVRWIGATSTNKTVTGDFMFLTFKVKTASVKATSISLEFSSKDTTAAPAVTGNPPILLTYNQPSVSINLNGYVPVVNHTLSFGKNTTDEVTNLPAPQLLAPGTVVDLEALAKPARIGYNFLGWSTDGSAILNSFTMPAADATLLAVWELIPPTKYTVTYDKNTTDAVTGMPAAAEYEEGQAVSLTAEPARTGYDFIGWSTDKTTVLNSFTMPAANTTLYAVWELIPPTKYTVTYDKNTTDAVIGMPAAAEYEAGQAVSLTAKPERSGYDFIGWSTDKTTVLNSFTMPAANTTLYAVWELINPTKYTVTYDKNATDAVTGMPAAAEYEAGQAVALTAEPSRTGYDFLGWSTDKSTILNSFTMPAANTTLYAVWELITHEVIIPATSTKEGAIQTLDFWNHIVSSVPIPKLPHFGTLRGIQVPTGATTGDPKTTVRMILGINSLEYLKAGFIVASSDDLDNAVYTPGDVYSKEINSKTVYTTLTVGDKTYNAAAFGAKYLVVIEIANFPQAAYGYDVRFQGFAVTEDGEYHFDTNTITKVATLING